MNDEQKSGWTPEDLDVLIAIRQLEFRNKKKPEELLAVDPEAWRTIGRVLVGKDFMDELEADQLLEQ